ncbi:MAG TPA: PLP-dependent aminotransferase family protein [Streptosporangiaceae bacterium]
MAKTRATSGVDLHLELTGSRVRDGLERALREAVQTGRLHPGVRLPSSRALATDLGIARNTVADAYNQLAAEGWLTARQGSGTRVASRPAGPAARVPAPAPPADARARYDLRAGVPDLSAFPRPAWLAAARRALGAAPAAAFGYPEPAGAAELRHALAGYLSRARGLRVTADRIVICAGFVHGLAMLSQLLRARGAHTLAVEGFSQPLYRDIAVAAGLRVRPLPVDSGGAVTGRLGRADAVLLTPAHQFPLGVALTARRRTQAVEWALARGGLIIEDDYDGEYRYDRQPLGAMQALAPEHVVYAGTASKTLAPGLRLGWLVLPAHLAGPVADASAQAGPPVSGLEQLTLAEFITSGGYDRHIRRSRLVYRRRRDQLIRAIDRNAAGAGLTGISAGLHALLHLPAGHTEDQVCASAARRGLAVGGLAGYTTPAVTHPPALVVGYAGPPAHGYTAALARLCAALSDSAPAASPGLG